LNAKPDDPAAVEPPADSEPTAPEVSSEVSSEVNRWMAGMLGDAAQRLEAIERLDEMGDAAIAAATCLMRTGDAESRRGAAAYLGIRISPRDAEAIAELCSALNDADSQVRQVALQAIDRLPKSQLVQALAGLIALAERADEDETFRVLALRKLGSLGADGRRASEALERLGREDDSSKVRIAAFSTLAKVAKPEFAEKFYVERLAECEARDERRLAAKWLGRVTTSAAGLHGLVAAFADSDKEVRMAATHALVDIGKPAVQALAQGLESPEAQVRQYSAFTLGKLGRLGAGAIDQLRRATEDEDERVRRVAEAALRLVEGG
jgi:HEAT repeat protein